MKVIDCSQRSPEWFAARCGIPTSSNFDKILTIDGKVSKQRTKYLYRLAGEKVSGVQEETYQNAVMQRGIEMEGEARALYQLITGQEVQQVGFCLADGYGASPDGIVGEDGLIEIKCPIVSTQVSYLLAGTLPTEYFQQVQGQLLVTGRKWADFVSYYPGLKPLIVRVEADEAFIKILKLHIELFCGDLKVLIDKIK